MVRHPPLFYCSVNGFLALVPNSLSVYYKPLSDLVLSFGHPLLLLIMLMI